MKKLVRSKHFYLDLFLLLLFCTGCYFLATRTTLLLSNSLLLSVSVAVGIAYIPIAWAALRGDVPPQTQHLALGISYHWTGGAAWRILALIWILGSQRPEFVNNNVVAALQAWIALGGFYHLTSPGALATNKPSTKGIAIGLVCGAAFFIAAMLSTFKFDLTPFVDWAIPHMPGACEQPVTPAVCPNAPLLE
jgi:hypothetical protein